MILNNTSVTVSMNKTINKFLSAEETFMPEMGLRQPWFTYNACGPLKVRREYKNEKIGYKLCLLKETR